MTSRSRPHKPNPAPIPIRQIEVTKSGATLYDWRDPYHLALTLKWSHFFLLLLAFYLLLNVFFAALYVAVPDTIANAESRSFTAAFFFSIETLATVGYGVMSPASVYGHIVASSEILTGMIFTAIMTGLIFVRFSRPRSKILFADHPVVTLHNGKPTLMIRLGNGRMSKMGNASATLSARLVHKTSEGVVFRVAEDLPLIRSRLPTFDLAWTLMHVLDEKSPLGHATADTLKASEALLIVTIEARDHTLGATVYDMRQYPAEAIFYGHRYQDTVTVDEEGRVHADMTRLSWVEPVP